MTALSLHHTIFTNEKVTDFPLRSASSFLHPVSVRDESPTSHLFASAAYQDLIERQPTHPNGPMSGWDLGLNLLGDPITVEEHKSLRDRQTTMKLRRLRAINITLELLFGIWGTYITIRYFLAFVDGPGDTGRISALVLGIMSTVVVILVTISSTMPLLPRQSYWHTWRNTRLVLRACYLLLLGAGPMINLVLVFVWRPKQLCSWDIDISWSTSAMNTVTSLCHTAPFGAWIAAAVVRLTVTWVMILSFIYTLRSYHETRHPFETCGSKYTPYFSPDPEDISPVSTSSPLHVLKSKFTRSNDSGNTFNRSNITLPKYNSISTLAPSTSCTGHSPSHSTPSPKDISPPKVSSPSQRASVHPTQSRSETPSWTQPANVVTEPSSVPPILRRKSHVSFTQVTSDITLSGTSHSVERLDGQTTSHESSETRSYTSSRPYHRWVGVSVDVRKTSSAWESMNAHHVSQTSVSSTSFLSTHDSSESIIQRDQVGDDDAHPYGYGVSGSTYPYLDMYNPRRPGGGYGKTPSCEDMNEHGIPHGQRRVIPAFPDVSSEPSSPTREEECSSEEEEYVAMMGGFVRRMATIESLGSREAAGTAATTTGSAALQSLSSRAPGSPFSSVRFAEYGSSCTPSVAMMSLSREGSHSTAYLSFSSGGTGVRVNERGELLPVPSADRSAAGSPYDGQFYTASGSSFPRMDDEG